MRPHGLDADRELLGDLGVGAPVLEQLKHLALARGQLAALRAEPLDTATGGR